MPPKIDEITPNHPLEFQKKRKSMTTASCMSLLWDEPSAGVTIDTRTLATSIVFLHAIVNPSVGGKHIFEGGCIIQSMNPINKSILITLHKFLAQEKTK